MPSTEDSDSYVLECPKRFVPRSGKADPGYKPQYETRILDPQLEDRRYVNADGTVTDYEGNVVDEKIYVPTVPKKRPPGADTRPRFQCRFCLEYFIHLRAHERNGRAGRNTCRMQVQEPKPKPASPKNIWKTTIDSESIVTMRTSQESTRCSLYEFAERKRKHKLEMAAAETPSKAIKKISQQFAVVPTPTKEERKRRVGEWVQEGKTKSVKNLFK